MDTKIASCSAQILGKIVISNEELSAFGAFYGKIVRIIGGTSIGGNSMGGCVAGGGSTGGSVGAGGSVGGSVGGGGLVGATLVAGAVVGTEVGTLGLGALESDSLDRWVGDTISVGVIVGVRVMVGVALGRVEVTVGRFEAVAVGTVAVGKGPSNAPAVIARAVFVLLALL